MSRLEEFVELTADPEVRRYWGPGGASSRDTAERGFASALARLEEHGFGRRWIVNKQSGAGLGFVETKYFGESCDDVSPDEVEIGWMLKRRSGNIRITGPHYLGRADFKNGRPPAITPMFLIGRTSFRESSPSEPRAALAPQSSKAIMPPSRSS